VGSIPTLGSTKYLVRVPFGSIGREAESGHPRSIQDFRLLVDPAVREHRSDQRPAAAGVEVAVDLILQAADLAGVVWPDTLRVPPRRGREGRGDDILVPEPIPSSLTRPVAGRYGPTRGTYSAVSRLLPGRRLAAPSRRRCGEWRGTRCIRRRRRLSSGRSLVAASGGRPRRPVGR
jgi:hypothetical protein